LAESNVNPMLIPFRNLIIALAIACVVGCDYHTDEVYFKDVSAPDWSDVTLQLTSNTTDTIYVFAPTSIGYNGVLGNHRMLEIRAYLNDDQIMYATEVVPVYIDPARFPTGFYNLVLEMTVSGGTGSMADKVNLEKTTITKRYVVALDDDEPAAPAEFTVAENDEQILLSWTPYKKFNFQYYKLTKYCWYDFGGYYDYCWTRELTEQDLAAFVDNSFVGGKAKYELVVGASNKTSATAVREISIPYNPTLTVKVIDPKTMELKWRRPPLENNLASYEISFPNDQDTRTVTVTNVLDTVLTIEPMLAFPATKYVRIIATDKGGNSTPYCDRHSDAFLAIGESFPLNELASVVYSKPLDKYMAIGYVQNRQSLIKINTVTHEVEQSFPSDGGYFGISSNGQYLYVLNEERLVRLDPATFDVISSIPSPVEPWWFDRPRIRVSNNNRMIFGNRVLDMNTGATIQTVTGLLMAISDDGQYIFGATKLFQYNGAAYTGMGFDVFGYTGDFTTDNKLVNYKQGSIAVYDLTAQTQINSISTTASYFSMDPATGLVGGFSDEYDPGPKKFFIYSPTGKQAEKEIDIANISTQYAWITLANNKLVSSVGFIVSVDWYK
jgi:hypothetical protein